MKELKPTKLCYNCFNPHQNMGLYCAQCDKLIITMTQQEFNSLRVGQFISNYEILHKYKEFLIVRCDDGHDLFDLNKINKLGLKVQPKTFMGLEIKRYDNVPCEISGNTLVYLAEVRSNDMLFRNYNIGNTFSHTPTSIRIL